MRMQLKRSKESKNPNDASFISNSPQPPNHWNVSNVSFKKRPVDSPTIESPLQLAKKDSAVPLLCPITPIDRQQTSENQSLDTRSSSYVAQQKNNSETTFLAFITEILNAILVIPSDTPNKRSSGIRIVTDAARRWLNIAVDPESLHNQLKLRST